jgi:V/A-type H+-transporting ATPase subunit D
MARLALNKASLSKQIRQLKTFERFLPSLDLKRRHLMAEQARERVAMGRTRRAMEELRERVAVQIPMLANREIDLAELVRVKAARLGEHNVVGIRLPSLQGIEVQVRDYPALPASSGNMTQTTRHCIDNYRIPAMYQMPGDTLLVILIVI